jgi:hypothetical protein
LKKSRIRRLIPKKLARQIARSSGSRRSDLEAVAERESAVTIAKMQRKGFELVTRLESGEGVFVREDDKVSLHVQLPRKLYDRLGAAAGEGERSKRDVVITALEKYLDGA